MKKILSFIASFVLLFSSVSVLGFNTYAAGKSVLSFSKNQVEVGEEVTVTVKINADETIYAIEFALNYDPDILEFVSGDDCSGGAGVVSVAAGNTSSSASKSYTFKALKSGSCYISTGDMVCVNANEELISVPNQGSSMTVKNKQLSGNANLKSLSVSSGKLSPAFSSGKTSYKVTVDKDVTSCDIFASVADSSAKVQVKGGSNLKVGKNKCTVTVTAANGTQKVYNIVITRKNDASKPVESSSKQEVSSEVSSEEVSSEEETESKETESEEEKDEEETNALATVVNGKEYFILNDLEGITLPVGFSEMPSTYNDEAIEVAVDKNQTYALYYLGTTDSDVVEPYTYDIETDAFTKLNYFSQNGRFYIFDQVPEEFEVPSGYYASNTRIGDFNVSCYTGDSQELSAFYYVYCYNGEDFGFYRYDSVEKVLQRYPELKLRESTPVVPSDIENQEENFISKFKNLSFNAKMIVVGIVLVILALLILLVLFAIKLFYHRGEAEFVSNLDYTEDFDSIEYNSGFDTDKTKLFITEEDEDEEDFVINDEIKSADEMESDYITEENEKD